MAGGISGASAGDEAGAADGAATAGISLRSVPSNNPASSANAPRRSPQSYLRLRETRSDTQILARAPGVFHVPKLGTAAAAARFLEEARSDLRRTGHPRARFVRRTKLALRAAGFAPRGEDERFLRSFRSASISARTSSQGIVATWPLSISATRRPISASTDSVRFERRELALRTLLSSASARPRRSAGASASASIKSCLARELMASSYSGFPFRQGNLSLGRSCLSAQLARVPPASFQVSRNPLDCHTPGRVPR